MNSILKTIELSNSLKIPCMALGTWPLNGKELDNAILSATSYNLLSIDSARDYHNEKSLGNALLKSYKKNNLKREDFFLTTKIGNSQQADINIDVELEKSLNYLKTDYLDMWLMHWPYPKHFLETWRLMEKVYKSGKVKAIGVCNFRERHLSKLLDNCEIAPMLNQFEIHPLKTEEKLIKYCFEKNIVVEAHTPLAHMDKRITSSIEINKICKKYNKTIAQIVLRWHIERGVIPIPKSSNEKRIKENTLVFDFNLLPKEIEIINSLNENYKFYPESLHCPGY